MSTGAERPSHQLLRHSGSRNRLFSSNPNCKKPAQGSLTSAAPTGERKKKKRGKIGGESFTNAGKKAPKAALLRQAEHSWMLHKVLPTGFLTQRICQDALPDGSQPPEDFATALDVANATPALPPSFQVGWHHLSTGGNDADPWGAAHPGIEKQVQGQIHPA